MNPTPDASRPGPAAAPEHLVLELGRVDDLFVAPGCNPFSPFPLDALGEAGLDWIMERLQRNWPRRPTITRLTLRLPPEQLPPESAQHARDAIRRYCQTQQAKCDTDMHITLARARRQLAIAAVVAALCLALGVVLIQASLDALPGFFRGLAAVMLALAAGIALYHAGDSMLFEWAPLWRRRAAYRAIQSLDIRFEPIRQPPI